MLGQQQRLQQAPGNMIRDDELSLVSLPRKRNRDTLEMDDEVDDLGLHLELNKSEELPSLHSLKNEFLSAARTISQDRVRKVLFIDCEDEDLSVPPTPRMNNALLPMGPVISDMDTAKDPLIISTNLHSDSSVRINLPTKLFHLVEFLSKNSFSRHNFQLQNAKLFSIKTVSGTRIKDLNDRMDHIGIFEALRECDCQKDAPELASLVLDVFKHRKPIFHTKFHGALKGILALNNTSENRLPGATTPLPTDSTIKLLRAILIMIESESRHILHYTLDFLRRVCDCSKTKTNITSTARELSRVFGPIFVGTDSSMQSGSATPSSRIGSVAWAETFCELLIYAHGLTTNDTTPASGASAAKSNRKILVRRKPSVLWKVPSKLQDSINECVNLQKTPSRRSVMSANVTPSRRPMGTSVSRVIGQAGMPVSGSSSRRVLFGSPKVAPKALPDFTGQPKSPAKFLFTGSMATQFSSCVSSQSYAFGNGLSSLDKGGNGVSSVYLSSLNATASTDRNSFAKRLRLE